MSCGFENWGGGANGEGPLPNAQSVTFHTQNEPFTEQLFEPPGRANLGRGHEAGTKLKLLTPNNPPGDLPPPGAQEFQTTQAQTNKKTAIKRPRAQGR